ncbi:MAG: hypothetical protein H0X66_16715 [Verrucomicrobia bacterium]|nr:hypothetical protein [Verrucomicrobiota bacterium]
MTAGAQQHLVEPKQVRQLERYTGKVVYMYAFDVAYEMTREPIREILGHPVAQFSVDSSKRTPKHLFFYRPQMVRLPAIERFASFGRVMMERAIKLLPVGAFSITVSVPFEVESIEELVEYHDLQFNNGFLIEEVRRLADEVRLELFKHFIRPVDQMPDEEAYTVFCLNAPLVAEDGAPISAEDWLLGHRREVASLLTQETDVTQLSRQEADESTGRYLTYYENDLVVVDWDAALMIEEPVHMDETLYVMELANLQLAELEAYDRILDDALDRSYRDLADRSRRARREVMRDLREIRIDLARLSDELQNISKFFGDWHMARIYQTISTRFHLNEWHRSIDEKLKTLDNLYIIMNQDLTNRWMLILEAAIVLLFIIDLIVIFFGLSVH